MFKYLFGVRSKSRLIDIAFAKTAEMLRHAGRMNDLAMSILLGVDAEVLENETADLALALVDELIHRFEVDLL